jgi:phosphotriesterase-related protein
MAEVPAAAGTIDSSRLGVTLMHEHLCFPASEKHYPRAMEYQVSLAQRAMDVGINTIVDLTPYPDVGRVLELARRVPNLNLILSTGAYLHGSTPAAIRELDEEGMVERMTRHLTEGYEGFEDAGVRAGIIKVAAAGPALTAWELKNFRAAARVHRELCVPIATHACSGAKAQMEALRDSGADLRGTFYSHVEAEFGWEGRALKEEAGYLEQVTQSGGCLQFNNFGFEFDTPFDDLLYLINYFEEHGYGDRVFLSIDANWTFDDEGRVWHEAEKQHPETGKRTYAYMITHAVPMLMAAGISLQRIHRYLVDNPRRFFEVLAD